MKDARKKLKEAQNKMENIQNEYQGKSLPTDVQNTWDQMRAQRDQAIQDLQESGQFEIVSGIPLNKEKNKIYGKSEKVYTPSNEDITAENYLRAVMDKPQNDLEKEAINNSLTSDGYELPVRVSEQIIDKLRAQNPLIQAGAGTVELRGNETNWVTIDEDPQAVWHSELVEENTQSGSFGKVGMKPKTVMTMFEVSRELIQDSNNAGEALSIAMTNALSDAIIDVSFTGSGSAEPTGMSSLVTQTELYSGSVSYTELVKANTQLYSANVPEANRSFIYSPDINETLSLTTDDNNRFQDAPSSIRNYASYTNSNVPAGKAYIGDFSNFLYGFRMNISLEQYNSVSAKKFGQLWLAVARMDLAVLRPKAFVRIESS